MNAVSLRVTPWLAVGVAAWTLGAPSRLSAQTPRPLPEFVEVPGAMEFSGYMIARPIQREEGAARGLTETDFQQLRGQAAREMLGVGIQRAFPEVDEYVLPVPAGQSETALARRLMATGAFSYVEPDWIVHPVNCGNDPQYSQQWHHQSTRMDTCGAWTFTTGTPTVVVAICDTGIRTTHQDLRLNRQEGYHVPTQRWESQGGPVNDIQGHGTACTGSAAANGNNALGVAGMGWNLGHRMMRVTDSTDGSASLSNLTLAARTAADRGDKVASVSYSGVTSSSVFTTGTYVRSKGALLVWAAGNSNVNMSGNRNDDVIVVGATDQNDAKASFSSYGSLVDLVAPGVSIRTTSNGGDASYSSVSGTSFSTPIVAGLCGLIWSRNPNLTPVEVEAILRSTCDDLGAAGVDDIFGHGRVDAARALAATPDPGVDLPPATPTGLAATAGDRQVVLSWNASTESDLAGYSVWRSEDNQTFTELTGSLLSAPGFTDSGLNNGITYHYAVYAEDKGGQESDPARVSATPVAPPPSWRPDALIKNSKETSYLGDNVYSANGASQLKAQNVKAGRTGVFHMLVQNDGSAADSFTVRGPGNSTGFTVRYLTGLTGGTDITSAVTGAGWRSGSLAAGSSAVVRVEVSVVAGTRVKTRRDTLVTVTSDEDSSKVDGVVARVTVN